MEAVPRSLEACGPCCMYVCMHHRTHTLVYVCVQLWPLSQHPQDPSRLLVGGAEQVTVALIIDPRVMQSPSLPYLSIHLHPPLALSLSSKYITLP